MEMTGEQLVASPRDLVWKGLNDPEVLRQCIVGCQVLELEQDSEYRIELLAAVGPVKARFKGRLAMSDITPPDSYSLSFEGSGGPAGFGKGTAKVVLSQAPEGTRLAYSVSARIGGKLAQVGSRLIDGVAKKMADDFFSRFTQQMVHYALATASVAPAGSSRVGSSAEDGVGAAPAPAMHGVGAQGATPAAAGTPTQAAAPVYAPTQAGAFAQVQVAGMVPIVAWVPAGSVLPGSSAPAPVRAPLHPSWWILGTAVFMVLLYFAFLRGG